ncbi:MAG: hypothetical protein ABIV63_12055 [Caldimonas sp.]
MDLALNNVKDLPNDLGAANVIVDAVAFGAGTASRGARKAGPVGDPDPRHVACSGAGTGPAP